MRLQNAEMSISGDEFDRSRYALPISKLRGVPTTVRVSLKSRRITTCAQLLANAGKRDRREVLSRQTGIDAELLLRLVQRADMARVNGIGAVFGMMLEDLGVRDVGTLARQDPVRLHEMVRDYNMEERIARRSPTLEEVEAWVAQAAALEPLID